MGISGLFNQTVTLYTKSSYNEFGREVIGSGASHKARVQPVTKTRLLPNGQTVRIDAIAYVKPDLSVNIDDRIDFSGANYKVFGKSLAVDGAGATQHIKLELIEWKTT